MSKTPEEIKKGIKCVIEGCMEPDACEGCPYYIKDGDVVCYERAIVSDAIAYIEQLEERINMMMIQMHGNCVFCVYRDLPMNESPCDECLNSDYRFGWEYDGLPELTKKEAQSSESD